MGIIGQAQGVRKAVKNVGRLREILGATARFGFGAVLRKSGLGKFVPSTTPHPDHVTVLSDSGRPESLAIRLRLLFEELGPSFIKIGQILSGRPDLVPAEIVTEFEKLQDQAPSISFNELKSFIEQDLARPLHECFASVDPEPLATASIAQVHAARTLDGDDVVLKVKKPGVDRLLQQDLEILEMIASALQRYIPELRPFKLPRIVSEFRKALLLELNFTMEANNTNKFRENFADNPFLVVPKVYKDLSGAHVLTLERLRGIKLSQVEDVRRLGLDPSLILAQGLECFFQSIMVNGFFHADPHAGNILVLPDGRMGLLDFGSVVRLSQRSRDSIINMFLALVFEDYDALVFEYLSLTPSAETGRSTATVEALQRDVREIMSPYYGLPLKDIPAGKCLLDATSVAFKHHISLPQDLVMVFKSIMTLEGIGRSLDPHFDLLGSAGKFAKIVLKQRYSPSRLLSDAAFFMRDWGRLLQKAPHQIGEILRLVETGQVKVRHEVAGLDRLNRNVTRASERLSSAIAAGGLFIAAGMVSTSSRLPQWAEVSVYTLALVAGAYALWKTLRD